MDENKAEGIVQKPVKNILNYGILEYKSVH
jgi:hypothetical protein